MEHDSSFKDMNLDRLRVFLAVAQAGGFSKAGNTLGVSQSALSRQVSLLEKNLKTSLFVRYPRWVELTKQGRIFYETVSEVFKRLESTQGRLIQDTTEAQGILKISTTAALSVLWLAPLLPEFVRTYPQIKLSIVTNDHDTSFIDEGSDVAIRPCVPSQQDVVQRYICSTYGGLYASASYLETYGEPKQWQDLERHHLISFSTGEADHPYLPLNWFLQEEMPVGTCRDSFLSMNSVLAMKSAVEAGVGIAPLFIETHEKKTQGEKLIRVLPDFRSPRKVDIYYTYSERLRGSKKIAILGDFLSRNLGRSSFGPPRGV